MGRWLALFAFAVLIGGCYCGNGGPGDWAVIRHIECWRGSVQTYSGKLILDRSMTTGHVALSTCPPEDHGYSAKRCRRNSDVCIVTEPRPGERWGRTPVLLEGG